MNYTEELGKLADHQSRMLKNVSIDEMLAMSQAILDAKRIYVAGWGRAGNNIKMLSMDCSQIGLHTHIVGDNSTPSIHEGDILVIGSGSGKTGFHAAVRQAGEVAWREGRPDRRCHRFPHRGDGGSHCAHRG